MMNQPIGKTWSMIASASALAILLAAGSTGCQTTEETAVPNAAAEASPFRPATRPMTESLSRVGGPVDMASSAALIDRQRLASQRRGPERAALGSIDDNAVAAMPVRYAARAAAADDALRVLINETLGRSYMIDPEVAKDTVTLDIDAMMTEQDVFDLLDALAVMQGWTVETSGDVVIVAKNALEMIRSTAAPILTDRTLSPTEAPGIRVFKLDYIGAKAAADACKDLLSKGGKGVAVGNLLVLADRIQKLNHLGDLIRALDAPAFEGVEVWTYLLANARPEDATKTLDAIARASGMNPTDGDPIVAFVPINGTKRLMTISRDPLVLKQVRRWVDQVDRAPDNSHRQTYLYRVQHYAAVDLDKLIRGYLGNRYIAPNVDLDPTTNQVRVVLSEAEDLLLFDATPEDYADLVSLLARVDVPRQQVQLQCIVAEVTLGGSLQWGVDYFLSNTLGEGILDLTGSLTSLGPLNPAGAVSFTATDGFAVLQALQGESEVVVLSTPSVTVRDKDEAEFQVGAEVPILTASLDSSSQSGGTTGIRNEVEYRDTGLILKVQPMITESGEVTQVIDLEIKDAAVNSSSGIDSPQFTKRSIKTTVTAPHGRTVLLAGIVSKNKTDSVSKIPLLGDVPLVGLAFQNISKTTTRTELVLMITPTIINDPGEIQQLATGYVAGLENVRRAIEGFDANLPGSLLGSLNPARSRRIDVVEPSRGDADQNPGDEPGREDDTLLGLADIFAARLDANGDGVDAAGDPEREVARFIGQLLAAADHGTDPKR
jgi:general secretion pathway protein D